VEEAEAIAIAAALDGLCRLVLGFLLLGMLGARAWYERPYRAAGPRDAHFASRERRITRVMLASFLVPHLLWFFSSLLDGAALPIPGAVRLFVGGPLGALGLGLFVWVHRTLGIEWSPVLELRAGHRLITAGPYAHVRHPMYLASYVMAAGFGLLAANAVPPLVQLLATSLLVAVRVPDEDAMLRGRFGAAWEAWAARTGRVLPRWRRSARRAG
jgi:protein-S-isoprenylcysteine O-methyltransferase Ste14